MTSQAILEICGLQTCFDTPSGTVHAVDGVDLVLHAGEVLALVGESGSGKTVTALSALGLVVPPGRITAGSIRLRGEDLLAARQTRLQQLRGAEIAMVFQQPRACLNPVQRIGEQIAEQFIRHRGLSTAEAHKRAIELLGRVELPDPIRRARDYPHQLSGGQAQRVMIAIAIALQPAVLIADEPTTALDVTVQAQLLELMQRLCRESGTALLLVTHDLGVVAQVADRVAVMYAGQIVEQAPVLELFDRPQHPYTRGLLGALPVLGQRRAMLTDIPGSVPVLDRRAAGCRFAERCDEYHRLAGTDPKLARRCLSEPPVLLHRGDAQQAVRCWAVEAGAHAMAGAAA
ncbi:MAG: methionine ABC transporter ATP-binding protein [Methylibium sp.]|nr:methionine ABC transporter ATP-binding protein [Methylibium sp.]